MQWLEPQIKRFSARILEVGCGHGHLAASLAGSGHQVVAIESDADAVAAARYKGVDVRHGLFPDCDLPERYEEHAFDVVVFSRSLHQMHHLDQACETAFSLLAPGGVVLVEDWAWNIIDERTAAWAYGMMGVGRAAGFVPDERWRSGNEPLRAWLAEHEGFAHPIAAMRTAITKHSKSLTHSHTVTIHEESAPYFYRYFCDYLANADGAFADNGSAIVESVLAAEQQMLAARAMAPLGWRLAAVRSDG